MKIYNTQAEVEAAIQNGVLTIAGDVKFECSISIKASIVVEDGDITAKNITAKNITAKKISAWDINTENIIARNINVGDINAKDITAKNINAWNINARNIVAEDINAWDITADNITAWHILYYAFCSVYESIKCTSIRAERKKHQEPVCLDGKLEIILTNLL
jgi:hypothetical protein